VPLTLYPVVIPCPLQTTLNVLDKKVERLVVNVPQMVIRYLPLRDFWLDSFGTTQVRLLSPLPCRMLLIHPEPFHHTSARRTNPPSFSHTRNAIHVFTLDRW